MAAFCDMSMGVDIKSTVSVSTSALGAEVRSLCDATGARTRCDPGQVGTFREYGPIQGGGTHAERRTFG